MLKFVVGDEPEQFAKQVTALCDSQMFARYELYERQIVFEVFEIYTIILRS